MNVIGPLIQFQQQMRVFHWQTASFAQHKAFGKMYDNLDALVDSFVETYMGIFGKSKPNITFQINLKSLSDDSVVTMICDDFESYLKSMSQQISDHTDLLNIRDTMLGELHTLKYLLMLK